VEARIFFVEVVSRSVHQVEAGDDVLVGVDERQAAKRLLMQGCIPLRKRLGSCV
jgi:hypothetical protein